MAKYGQGLILGSSSELFHPQDRIPNGSESSVAERLRCLGSRVLGARGLQLRGLGFEASTLNPEPSTQVVAHLKLRDQAPSGCKPVLGGSQCKPAINKPPPLKGMSSRIPSIIPIKRKRFMNHGSGLPQPQ